MQFPEKSANLNEGGAQSGAKTLQIEAIDPGLAVLIEAWSSLPETARAEIMALVEGAKSAPCQGTPLGGP